MSKKKRASPAKPDARLSASSVAVVIGLAVIGIVGGLLLEERLRERGTRAISDVGARASARGDGDSKTIRRDERPALRDNKRPAKLPSATSAGVAKPWEASPSTTKKLPPNHVPAWEIGSPPPANTDKPEPPKPPSNPQTGRPPKHNPGGVNGTRPPRELE